MAGPKPRTTEGVPWGDHNATPSQSEDRRREEYEEGGRDQNADERARHAKPNRSKENQEEQGRRERPGRSQPDTPQRDPSD